MDIFLGRGDGLFDELDALNRLLESLQVVDLLLDPVDYLRVGVAEFLLESVNHVLVLVIGMAVDPLLRVTVGVEVKARHLILCQLLVQRLYTKSKIKLGAKVDNESGARTGLQASSPTYGSSC